MEFSFDDYAGRDRYKLLTSLVVPRPIALVSTVDREGIPNAAPYSFFNVFSHAPAICVLGIERRNELAHKDTASNIEHTGEFVVNLVNEDIAEAMNVCAVDFPAEVSELDHAGFTLAPSTKVKPGRIAEAPASLECRNHSSMILGTDRRLVIGEILTIHIQDHLVNKERLHVDFERYRPVGRLFANLYCKTGDTFKLVRETYDEWSKKP